MGSPPFEKTQVARVNTKIEREPLVQFVDLFAGLGGFHVAAKRLGGECVFACEIDPELRELYTRNFGQPISGDIANVALKTVPYHDLLCAGFPCQPFSKAGDQIGLEDAVRGKLFWRIIELVKLRRPMLVLLENVAHFVNHDEGNTYLQLKGALEAEGYQVEFRQYSPHQFGVPQIRERIYMLGYLGDRDAFPWPEKETTSDQLSISTILDTAPADAVKLRPQVQQCIDVWQEFLDRIPSEAKLPSFPIWAMEFDATYPFDRGPLGRVPLYELEKARGCFGAPLLGLTRKQVTALLPNHAQGTRRVFPRWKQMFIKQNREFYATHRRLLREWLPKVKQFPPSLQKLEWNCQGDPRDLSRYVLQFRASGLRVKRPNTAPSLVAMTSTQVPIIAWERRYITPRECARLQSLESLQHLPEGISAIEALGNAVNATVVEKILSPWMPLLGRRLQPQARAA